MGNQGCAGLLDRRDLALGDGFGAHLDRPLAAAPCQFGQGVEGRAGRPVIAQKMEESYRPDILAADQAQSVLSLGMVEYLFMLPHHGV